MNGLKAVYAVAGMACIVYYFVFSLWSRFGLSLSWMWLFFGVVLLGAAVLAGRVPGWVTVAWRSVLSTGLAVTIALIALVAAGMNVQAPEGLDYIIVLGARVEPDGSPSPALRRRLDAAKAYLEENPDTVAIVSGGYGTDEPMAEAVCMQRELISAGIAPERILVEDQSSSTEENLAFSKALIDKPYPSVGVVTNNFHVYRALLYAKQAGFTNAHGVAAEYVGPTLLHYMVREVVCLVVGRLTGSL